MHYAPVLWTAAGAALCCAACRSRPAGMLCRGPRAKDLFLAAGGLGALLAVAGQPLADLRVVAAVANALLNLSSHVPSQVRCVPTQVHVCVFAVVTSFL